MNHGGALDRIYELYSKFPEDSPVADADNTKHSGLGDGDNDKMLV